MKKVIIKRSRYVDSVTLMGISEKARKKEGIINVEVAMGTKANKEVLLDSGFVLADDITANDLIIAIDSKEELLDKNIEYIESLLNKKQARGKVFTDLNDEDVNDKDYDIVQISLPGEYAFVEGMKALKKGLHVFMFSDNVPLEQEKIMKEYAYEHNLLCMGPDCGVALIGGLSLGAGSIIRPGRVGIVGASGSGAQEVGCLVEALGDGISSLIGTGGRDLNPMINGLMMKMGMKLLDQDDNTEVIVLVSKLADLNVMKEVLNDADKLQKPVVAVFLGSNEEIFKGHRTIAAFSLEAAAVEAVKLLGINKSLQISEEEIEKIAESEVKKFNSKQKYIRGLYCGGTFTEEGLIYYKNHIPNITLYSNISSKYTIKLDDKDVSKENTILDMGAEDFTEKLPHPVFEPNLRLKRLEKELLDDEVALITLDFITGPGVHEDPVTSFIELIKKHRQENKNYVSFIVNICGSIEDPQNILKIKEELKNAGVIVSFSNNETARIAGKILSKLNERSK
ncbi:MAG: FdrA family protein [Bacilli bacterium]